MVAANRKPGTTGCGVMALWRLYACGIAVSPLAWGTSFMNDSFLFSIYGDAGTLLKVTRSCVVILFFIFLSVRGHRFYRPFFRIL